MTPEESLNKVMAGSGKQVPERARHMLPLFLETCEPNEIVESLYPSGTEIMFATNERLVHVDSAFRTRVQAWSWKSMSRFAVKRELWVKKVTIRVAGVDAVTLKTLGGQSTWLLEQLRRRGIAEA